MLYRARKYLRNQHIELKLRQALKNKCFVPEQSLLIFSDPRGGSTWLTQLINKIPRTAVVWEPLHLGEGSRFRALNFGWRQYIPREASWPEARLAFEKLLRGNHLNAYTTYLSNFNEYENAETLIYKFCRGNALLPWLVKQFDFRYLPIYLVRHPFAVVASQLKHGGWNEQSNKVKIPNTPFNSIYTQHAEFLFTLQTVEEQLVATWCITNNVVLKDRNNDRDWITMHYEDLFLNPEYELEKVFSRWKVNTPDHLFSEIRQPSWSTVDSSPLQNSMYQLSKWQQQFSDKTIYMLEDVLQYFKIRHYNSSPLPIFHNGR